MGSEWVHGCWACSWISKRKTEKPACPAKREELRCSHQVSATISPFRLFRGLTTDLAKKGCFWRNFASKPRPGLLLPFFPHCIQQHVSRIQKTILCEELCLLLCTRNYSDNEEYLSIPVTHEEVDCYVGIRL